MVPCVSLEQLQLLDVAAEVFLEVRERRRDVEWFDDSDVVVFDQQLLGGLIGVADERDLVALPLLVIFVDLDGAVVVLRGLEALEHGILEDRRVGAVMGLARAEVDVGVRCRQQLGVHHAH